MRKKLSVFLTMAAAVLLSLPTLATEVKDSYGVITSPADGVLTSSLFAPSNSAH